MLFHAGQRCFAYPRNVPTQNQVLEFKGYSRVLREETNKWIYEAKTISFSVPVSIREGDSLFFIFYPLNCLPLEDSVCFHLNNNPVLASVETALSRARDLGVFTKVNYSSQTGFGGTSVHLFWLYNLDLIPLCMSLLSCCFKKNWNHDCPLFHRIAAAQRV